MTNYFKQEFSTGYIISIFVILIILFLGDFIRKYKEYSKNKDIKVKYLPCIAKPVTHYGGYIAFLIFFIPSVLLDIKNLKFCADIWGSIYVINILYSSAVSFLIFCLLLLIVIFFWQATCGNVMLINDKFIVFYNGRINFGEVNYVDIFPIKGIFRRRKIDIYVNGKLHTRFSIRNKYTCNITNIFKDRCKIV